ncbi:MAG TPA: alpha/beta hydrolase [Steroidobacteraceae bacterium]|nr:alpha/beta hydrolase [Steroidobacteraceae bacterium]
MPTSYTETVWTSHDALRLYARVYEGPRPSANTVLCLHGLTRNSRDFEDLAPHLQSRYRVIVPDVRGRGRSARDPDPQNYQPAIYLQDILGWMDSLGAARASIIGTSMGGLLAMMMGLGHRARVAAMVLNDMGPEVDPVGLERIKGYAGRLPAPKNWDDAIAQTRSMFGNAWPNLSADRWATLTRRAYRENENGVPAVDADPMIGEVLRAAPAAAANLWPYWKALSGIPTLAIRGAQSDILSTGTFAKMKAENPELEQLEVAQRGHAPLLDEPECVAAIDAFLAQVP